MKNFIIILLLVVEISCSEKINRPFSTWEPKYIREISAVELKSLYHKFSRTVYFPADKTYKLISLNTFRELLRRSPGRKYKYIPEIRDCDDFTKIVRAWMSENAWGTILISDIKIRKKNGAYHSLLGTLIEDKNGYKIVFGEPQTGKIVDKSGCKIVQIIP